MQTEELLKLQCFLKDELGNELPDQPLTFDSLNIMKLVDWLEVEYSICLNHSDIYPEKINSEKKIVSLITKKRKDKVR